MPEANDESRIFTDLNDPEFNSYFTNFQRSAFRLETHQHYDVGYEAEAYQDFLAGQERGRCAGIVGWIEEVVLPAVEAGLHMERVHVVEEPLSKYVKFEMGWAYEDTLAAGEGIRILPIKQGDWPDLPRQDFWLFDDTTLILMNYTDEGKFSSAVVETEPVTVATAQAMKSLTLRASVGFRNYEPGHV